MHKQDFYNVPNILTYIRLLCVPVFVCMFFMLSTARHLNVFVAFGVFVFASVTDVADGIIARKFHITSDLGRMLDPLADKLLQVTVAVCLCVNDFIHVSDMGMLFVAFPVILGAKELFMLVWGIILARKNIIVHSNVYGKVAAFTVAVGLIMSFFCTAKYNAYRIVTTVVLSVGCLLAYVALADYSCKLARQLNGSVKNKNNITDLKF